MGAFSTVWATTTCGGCGARDWIDVQFKTGWPGDLQMPKIVNHQTIDDQPWKPDLHTECYGSGLCLTCARAAGREVFSNWTVVIGDDLIVHAFLSPPGPWRGWEYEFA